MWTFTSGYNNVTVYICYQFIIMWMFTLHAYYFVNLNDGQYVHVNNNNKIWHVSTFKSVIHCTSICQLNRCEHSHQSSLADVNIHIIYIEHETQFEDCYYSKLKIHIVTILNFTNGTPYEIIITWSTNLPSTQVPSPWKNYELVVYPPFLILQAFHGTLPQLARKHSHPNYLLGDPWIHYQFLSSGLLNCSSSVVSNNRDEPMGTPMA